MIELIRASWKQIGVELTVRRYLSAELFRRRIRRAGSSTPENSTSRTLPGASVRSGDQENIFSCRRIPPNGQNVTRYCNAAVDRAMVDFNTTYDEARQRRDCVGHSGTDRARRSHDRHERTRADVIAYNSDLRNFRPNQVSPFDDMLNVDI